MSLDPLSEFARFDIMDGVHLLAPCDAAALAVGGLSPDDRYLRNASASTVHATLGRCVTWPNPGIELYCPLTTTAPLLLLTACFRADVF